MRWYGWLTMGWMVIGFLVAILMGMAANLAGPDEAPLFRPKATDLPKAKAHDLYVTR